MNRFRFDPLRCSDRLEWRGVRAHFPAGGALWLLLACAVLLPAPAWSESEVAEQYLTVPGVDGVPLQVVTAGDPDRPPVLLIHGIGQSHFMFYRQLRSDLADDFFLVSFDLRGHGASGKPWQAASYGDSSIWAGDVKAVIDAVGIERPLLVAWSFGSLVAMDFLREYGPESARALVLTGALGALLPFRMPDTSDAETAEFIEVRALQMSTDPYDRMKAAGRMVDWLVSDPLPAEDREVFLAYLQMLPAYVRRAIYARSYDNTDLRDLLATLPVHIALGRDDNPLLAEDAEVLEASYPGVSLSIYDAAGHSVFYEQPQRFNTELRELHKRAQDRSPAAE